MLHQKYVVEQATLAQIAKQFLCSKGTIREALESAKIPVRARAFAGHPRLVAYGWKAVKGQIVAEPAEQKVIETIVDLRRDGKSFEEIACLLTKIGIPTKSRRKKWNCGCVRVIFLRATEKAD